MRRWVAIGALVLFGVWAPYLYRELTSESVEKKGGAVMADEPGDALAEAEEPGGGTEAAPAGGEGADQGPAEEPEAENEPAPAEPGTEAPTQADLAPGEAPQAEAPAEAPAPTAPTVDEDGLPVVEQAEVPPAASSTVVFERVFDSEPRDALWAREAEARLLQVMTGAEVPMDTIKSARCQKTVCRLEVVWKPEDSTVYATALQSVRGEFGADMGVKNLGPGENDGEQRIDVYVPRQGYTLADLQR